MMFVIGLDIGYSNLKWALGQSDEEPRVAICPSGAAPVDRLPETLGNTKDGIPVFMDGIRWMAGIPHGHAEEWSRSLHQDYASSKAYLALFRAVLQLSGQSRIDRLITGLPVSQWTIRRTRDELVRRLKGHHAYTGDRSVSVDRVEVIPQPLGAYLDVLSIHHDPALLSEGRILVIDPGFYSVDWVLIGSGALRKSASGTSLNAMSVLLAETTRLIESEMAGAVSVSRIEEALRKNRTQVYLSGESLDIKSYLVMASEKVATLAVESLRESMRRERESIDAVIVTGGGASLYKSSIQEAFPAASLIVPRQPECANARGFYHYGGV